MDFEKLREKVAKEHDIKLYRQYTDKECAGFLKVDVSTIKRWRKNQLIPFIELPKGGIRFFGYHIVMIMVEGKNAVRASAMIADELGPSLGGAEGDGACPNTTTGSGAGNGTCPGETSPTPGIGRERSEASSKELAFRQLMSRKRDGG